MSYCHNHSHKLKMNVFNNKSLLALFTITLLISSSFTDGLLPQPRLGNPELANLKLKWPDLRALARYLSKPTSKQQSIIKRWAKTLDRITAPCGELFKCTPSKACQAYCIYEIDVVNRNITSCQKHCGSPKERCYYNPHKGFSCIKNTN